MERYKITQYIHDFIKSFIRQGGFYIDATVGNGYDTEFLLKADQQGRVIGFDVQKMAIENTKKRLKQAECFERCRLILDGHENMDQYLEESTVDIIVFNFGYLPGTSHTYGTLTETSIQAVKKGLALLKPGGLMSLCIYCGGDTGFEERDGLFNFLDQLDQKNFVIIKSEFYKRPNHPPIPVFIIKQR